MTEITMYAPNVYAHLERSAGMSGVRPIQPTLEEAKAILDREREPLGTRAPLKWKDEFGGASATVGDLTYEVVPVQVRVKPEQDYTRALSALRDARNEQLRHGHDWDVADVMQTLTTLGLVATR